jgi:peptide/nickel transport system permease protein
VNAIALPRRPAAKMIGRFAKSPSLRVVLKRVLQAIPVLWGVTFVTFALMNLLPGGSAAVLAGPGATKQAVAAIAHRLHLDEPFWVRYWHWLGQTVTGHLGASLASGQAVSAVIAKRLPVTAEMVGFALVLAVFFSVPLACLAVRRPHGIADRLSTIICIVGLSVPGFVLGLVAILIFAVHLRLLPAIGFEPISAGLWANIRTLILPSSTLGFGLMCTYTRVLRADLADQMNTEDYIVTARAKGIAAWKILVRHALRNSMFGFLTLIGLNLGVLIGGTVLIEQIFAIPGMGQALIQAVLAEDVTVVEGIVVVLSIAVVGASLLTDLLYAVLDPRIRYGR